MEKQIGRKELIEKYLIRAVKQFTTVLDLSLQKPSAERKFEISTMSTALVWDLLKFNEELGNKEIELDFEDDIKVGSKNQLLFSFLETVNFLLEEITIYNFIQEGCIQKLIGILNETLMSIDLSVEKVLEKNI